MLKKVRRKWLNVIFTKHKTEDGTDSVLTVFHYFWKVYLLVAWCPVPHQTNYHVILLHLPWSGRKCAALSNTRVEVESCHCILCSIRVPFSPQAMFWYLATVYTLGLFDYRWHLQFRRSRVWIPARQLTRSYLLWLKNFVSAHLIEGLKVLFVSPSPSHLNSNKTLRIPWHCLIRTGHRNAVAVVRFDSSFSFSGYHGLGGCIQSRLYKLTFDLTPTHCHYFLIVSLLG